MCDSVKEISVPHQHRDQWTFNHYFGLLLCLFSSLVCIYLRTVIRSNHTLSFSYVIKFFSVVVVVKLLLNIETRSLYVLHYASLHFFHNHVVSKSCLSGKKTQFQSSTTLSMPEAQIREMDTKEKLTIENISGWRAHPGLNFQDCHVWAARRETVRLLPAGSLCSSLLARETQRWACWANI